MMRNRNLAQVRRYSAPAIVCLLTLIFAACMPVAIPLPIPSGYVLLPVEVAPPATGILASVPMMTPVAPHASVSAEDAAAVAVVVADGPSPITHRIDGRAACSECHVADDGKNASPADHAGYPDSVCLFCHMPAEGEVALPPLPEEAEPEFCLACHGPFDALAAITADTLVDEFGTLGNPHMRVPHDGDNILGCDACHEVHAIPVTPKDVIPAADVKYCYAACHHEQTFEACSNCHDE